MQNKKKVSISIEIVIVLVIAACVLFLNFFTANKLEELERSSNEAMFIRNDLPFMNCEEFTEEILNYRPDACKMIELYDDQYNLLLMIRFDSSRSMDYNIKDYPDLINVLESNTEGQAKIGKTRDDYEEDIYFQWLTNSNNERRLIMVYSTKPVVGNIWVFSLVCYLVLILVFALFIRLQVKQYRTSIAQYSSTSKAMRDKVNS